MEKRKKNNRKTTLAFFAGVFLFLSWSIFPLWVNNAYFSVRAHACTPYPHRLSLNPKQDLLLSRFTTYFDGNNLPRSHNIRLACQKINGCKLSQGERFSFNQQVGARTKERGFLDANVILDGQFVPGTGGGVCQVSTTLFNAALLAGMVITESHSHSLQVGYVSPSLDAMVSSFSDLKFLNPAFTPVVIRMRTDKNSVTAEIYGKNSGYVYRTESVVLCQIPPPPPEICEGEEDCVLREEKSGIKSESYLVYYRHGKRVKSVRIRRDTYSFVQGKRQLKSAQGENSAIEEGNSIQTVNSFGKVTKNI